MPSKSSGASSSNLPTRASTRSKLTASGSLAVTENVPIRTTRSTRVASAAGGPAAPTAAKAASNGTRGISELIVKKLRPLAERNTGNTQSTTVPESDSGAAMLAATKKALRPVAAGVKLEDREPIKAYLRVRPALSNEVTSNTPYLTLLSDSEVQMAPPTSILAGMTSIRIPNPSMRRQHFSFTKVFPPETSQSDMFSTTTLPLVKDVLCGENGLIFAYGVTNSGKTYTVQGKSGDEQSGILPRALDVVFNSIKGHQDIPSDSNACYTSRELAGAGDILLEGLLAESQQSESSTRDSTAVPIDPSWAYRVFVSYAEIYNNQIYDLLNTALPTSENPVKASTSKSSVVSASPSVGSNVRGSFLPTSILSLNPFSWIGNNNGVASGAANSGRQNPTRGSITTVSRQALALRSDPLRGGRYVANLSEVPVSSAEDARKVVAMGQVNRRVFGTVANKESSRSHAVFTIRVERLKRDLKNETETVDCGRLSIVDLAGSERNKNTQATGERMDEANKINSSLMVLGQCMRILRNNQKKLSKTQPGGRPVRTEIPPYRMSKLTELFQEFFEGRGRAAMIVNVNPFDTGYHENAAVLEFSALASEIATVTTKLPPALSRKLSITSTSDRNDTPRASSRASVEAPTSATIRHVRLSLAAPSGSAPVERVIEVVEEAEEHPNDEEGYEDEEDDTLISRLFEELEAMRQRWIDAEIRCAVVEAETRESVMQEMEGRMKDMERLHAERLKRETEENELKMDLKIEMLSHAGALGPRPTSYDDYDETDDDFERSVVEKSLIIGEMSESPSPPEVNRGGKRFALSDGPDDVQPPSPVATIGLPDAPPLVLDGVFLPTPPPKHTRTIVDDNSFDSGEDGQSDEDEWLPQPKGKLERESDLEDDARRRSRSKRPKAGNDPEADTSGHSTDGRAKPRSRAKPSKTQQTLFLSQDEALDEPTIVPNRKARVDALGDDANKGGRAYVPDVGEAGTVKKKKRHLGGKAPVLTEDDILQVAAKADFALLRGTRGSVRRMDRNSK